jgi:hypothetical protein
MSLISNDQHDDLPPRIRRRMSEPFSPTSTVAQIREAAFAAIRQYQEMVLAASQNDCVLPDDALELARRAGKSPLDLTADLAIAQRAYVAWRLSVNP